MTEAEMRSLFYRLTSEFFAGATVCWAEQDNLQPSTPYVTIDTGDLNRHSFPLTADGENYYRYKQRYQVDLYTQGQKMARSGYSPAYINTAVSDMMEYVNYMESEEILLQLSGEGVSVDFISPVRDLSELQNESDYRYRAMAEFDVSFAQTAGGAYGLKDHNVPNASGGGAAEQEAAEIEIIEEVNIEEEEG